MEKRVRGQVRDYDNQWYKRRISKAGEASRKPVGGMSHVSRLKDGDGEKMGTGERQILLFWQA